MTPRIFVTGISGYIGGQVIKTLLSKHPKYQIVGLVRNKEQVEKIAAIWPSVQTVEGTLDSHDILVRESKKADVVIQMADCDHARVLSSIFHGLALGGSKGTFLQLSGTGSIIDTSSGPGQLSTKVYDDIADLEEIINFDTSHLHAATDQAIFREGQALGFRTAVLAPPVVYGTGEGPVRTKSMTLPWLVDAIKARGRAFTVGEGKNVWSYLHVKDLADVFVYFVEEALKPEGSKLDWNATGYYFLEAGEFVHENLVVELVKAMKQREIPVSDETDQIDREEAGKLHPYGFIWGTNSRSRGSRLRNLGWTAKQPTVFEAVHELFN